MLLLLASTPFDAVSDIPANVSLHADTLPPTGGFSEEDSWATSCCMWLSSKSQRSALPSARFPLTLRMKQFAKPEVKSCFHQFLPCHLSSEHLWASVSPSVEGKLGYPPRRMDVRIEHVNTTKCPAQSPAPAMVQFVATTPRSEERKLAFGGPPCHPCLL